MRVALLALGLFAVASVAQAQSSYGQRQSPYSSYGGYQAPRTTYDYQSGNQITTTPSYGGGATIRGYNTQTGSTWNTRVQPNGNATGVDASGNMWTYNKSTGNYMNSNGTVCIGKGALRTCN